MKTKILTQSPGRGQHMYHQRFLVCRVDINSNGYETTHFQTCKMKKLRNEMDLLLLACN